MIAYLRGRLLEKRPPSLVLDVAGVGYELDAPMTTFYALPETGSEVVLHVHFVVREDAQLLYGFDDRRQRDLFRALLKVNGVGPRVALAILSSLSADDFAACMAHQDVDRLTRVPGIGRKTAQRLVVEMRDKVLEEPEAATAAVAAAEPTRSDAVQDAVSALIALGYKPVEASRAVRGVAVPAASSEDLIRAALRELGGRAA